MHTPSVDSNAGTYKANKPRGCGQGLSHTFPSGNLAKNSSVLLVCPRTNSGGSDTTLILFLLYSAAIRIL